MTRTLLEAQGYTIQMRPSRDSHGEDAVVRVGGTDFTFQATTVPDAPEFWREAKHGSAITEATSRQAAAWLEGSVSKKVEGMPHEQRAATVIVLDVHDWGDRLAKTEVVTHLCRPEQNMAQRFGLAGISIAGSTPSVSTWIGGSLR